MICEALERLGRWKQSVNTNSILNYVRVNLNFCCNTLFMEFATCIKNGSEIRFSLTKFVVLLEIRLRSRIERREGTKMFASSRHASS